MGHYKSNVRDLEFNLFEVLELEKALATGEFGDLDGESVRQMLAEATRLAEGPVAESFAESDRNPPTFDPQTHAVSLPEPFKKSLRAWRQGEWFRVGLDEEVGGVPAPAMVAWAINELPLGANPAGLPLHGGPDHGGHPLQHRQRTAATLGAACGRTQLGRDHGAHRARRGLRRRCRPHQGRRTQADGTWHIEGVKRFITNGDIDDVFENIVHLVLARPEGAGAGHQGSEPVHRAEVLGRPGDRRARRAQRCVRHRPRAQDGAEGLGDLRAHASASTACPRSAGWSVTSTTASRRCSRSSSTRE